MNIQRKVEVMDVSEVIKELENTLCEVEEQYNISSINIDKLDSLIKKLFIVIEKDKFNVAQAYNYCKVLKELLLKKRVYIDLQCKYKSMLKLYNSKWIRTELVKKEKSISNRRYYSRVFHKEDDITKYLNENKEIL
jgi:hypothetical protein